MTTKHVGFELTYEVSNARTFTCRLGDAQRDLAIYYPRTKIDIAVLDSDHILVSIEDGGLDLGVHYEGIVSMYLSYYDVPATHLGGADILAVTTPRPDLIKMLARDPRGGGILDQELCLDVAQRWFDQAPNSWHEEGVDTGDDLRKDVGQVLRCLVEEFEARAAAAE